jgi:hypothetical protein
MTSPSGNEIAVKPATRTQTGTQDPSLEQEPCTVPLEDEDGNERVICQEPVGAARTIGGGEFPDPATPPEPPAPGSVGGERPQRRD